jgi:hypothetical protein
VETNPPNRFAFPVERYDPQLTPAQIKDEVQRMWLGLFAMPTPSKTWPESNAWNIEASVEYEDEMHASILIDGTHVKVQDRNGRYWFIRVWTAAD